MVSLISVLMMIALVGVLMALRNIRNAIAPDDRTYMDPLPPALRLLWPLVNLIAQHGGEYIPVEHVESCRRRLRNAGVEYLMTPVQFISLQATSALLVVALTLMTMKMLGPVNLPVLVAAGPIGWFFPMLKIGDLRSRREKAIVRALPIYLDFITMAVEAGMNLSGAISQAVEKGPEGPLRTELQKVMRDVSAGMTRMDAIRAMADRLMISEITSLASSLAQAERTGASVGASLRIQADQRRTERFQRAEKLALEAPVKLVFPLVAFIFPTTFLILGFPIAMKFLYEL